MDSLEAEAVPPPPPSSPPTAASQERAAPAGEEVAQSSLEYQQPQYDWQTQPNQYYMHENGAEYGLYYDAYSQAEQASIPASAPLPPAKRQKTGRTLLHAIIPSRVWISASELVHQLLN